MKNQRIGVWPATGVAPGILDLEKNFGKSVLNKFPKGFINSWHFDDKMNIRENYRNTKTNILKNGKQAQFSQQKRPRLTISFNNTNASQEDAAGGMEQPFTYPLVQGVHPEMHGYIPVYKDPNNIEIYMTHKRIRVNFEALLEVESLSDQEACLNMIENILKMQYGAFLEFVPATFILPNDMINTIYKVLYTNDIKGIETLESKEEKDLLYKKIGDEFYENLHKYSSCNGITRYTRNGNVNDNYFLYKQIYRKLYYEITSRPEKTDGERIGSIYSKYSITFSGFMEFEKPIAYILSMPDIVNGNSVTENLKASGNISYFRDHNPPAYMKYFGRLESLPKSVQRSIDEDKFKLIYVEEDVTMDSPTDVIDLIDWMGNANDKKNKEELKMYAAFIKTLRKEEFDKYFKVFIYDNMNTTPVDVRDIGWDGEILHIGNTDNTVLYKIYVTADAYAVTSKIRSLLRSKGGMKDAESK